jgi:hypothetical protein
MEDKGQIDNFQQNENVANATNPHNKFRLKQTR